MTGEIVIEWFDVLSTRSDGSAMATACLDVSTVAFQDSTGTTMPLGYPPEAQQSATRPKHSSSNSGSSRNMGRRSWKPKS
ncbi:hypothetical protein [Microbacterium sp. GCS4]|uniref:hypothetical protein n=1 Tax=Microbacterium sp. GCS4 TaxID=1692239 RepID=UPI0006820244|nr:hypothetical protein [Microbacterium sp. GCS4]KNY06322.1 hypothetical protein AKH00_11150 [Microbacterium sp. GCS4]